MTPARRRSAALPGLPLLAGLLLAPGLLLLAPPAAASCAAPVGPVRLDGEGPVFVGDVVETASRGRLAEVRVVDVWQGPDLPPVVVVQGGPAERGTSSSTERSYDTGTRYAFFVHRGPDGALLDSVCSATAPVAEHAALDPPGLRPPDPGAPAVPDPRSWVQRDVPAQVWLLVAPAVAVLLWRVRARPPRTDRV